MKKVKVFLSFLLSLLLIFSLASCSSDRVNTFMDKYDKNMKNYKELAENRLAAVCDAIKNKDTDKMRSLFSKKALDMSDQFDEDFLAMTEAIEGDITSQIVLADPSEMSEGGEFAKTDISYVFNITTPVDVYSLSALECVADILGKDNVGITSLSYQKKSDADKNSYTYDNRYNTFGIGASAIALTDEDYKAADAMFEKIISGLESKDAKLIKGLFAPYIIHEVEYRNGNYHTPTDPKVDDVNIVFDSGVDDIINEYKGKFVKKSMELTGCDYHDKQSHFRALKAAYDVETDAGTYFIYFQYVLIAENAPRPDEDELLPMVIEGLNTLQVIEKSKLTNFTWGSTQNSPAVFNIGAYVLYPAI